MCAVAGTGDRLEEVFFFFRQKTAYEVRISGWSSGLGSSDLPSEGSGRAPAMQPLAYEPITVDGPPEGLRKVSQRASCAMAAEQIGRASSRERVCQYV